MEMQRSSFPRPKAHRPQRLKFNLSQLEKHNTKIDSSTDNEGILLGHESVKLVDHLRRFQTKNVWACYHGSTLRKFDPFYDQSHHNWTDSF